MLWIFSFLILQLKSSNAGCNGQMSTIFVYDEYVCEEKVVCNEFLKQIDLTKAFERTPNMTDHFNPTAVICSGYHGRQVVKFYSKGHFEEHIVNAIEQYFWSPPNLAMALGMIAPMVYRQGYHLPKVRSVVVIFTSTKDQRNLELIEILLAEISNQNGQVYAVGVGTSIQENVLKMLSSEPKKRNENYFLKFNSNTLLRILRKERLESLYCSTLDHAIDTTQSLQSTENSEVASGPIEPQPSTTKVASIPAEPPTSEPSNPSESLTESSTFKENTRTTKGSIFLKSSLKSPITSTIENIASNYTWNRFGERDKIEPQLQAGIWKKTKRLARIYGKYFAIGALMGSIGAMAPYWTYCPTREPTKISKK